MAGYTAKFMYTYNDRYLVIIHMNISSRNAQTNSISRILIVSFLKLQVERGFCLITINLLVLFSSYFWNIMPAK